MIKTIRASYINGMFKPLEKLDIPEGQEITITMDIVSSNAVKNGIQASAGAWKDLIDTEKLKKGIYENRLISTRPEIKL
ncbi:MAG: antitoxin family protein [Candidatus Brocadiae bacterium]|nr:antitoxin family protein [Candidatus Brocadiia bacterium]